MIAVLRRFAIPIGIVLAVIVVASLLYQRFTRRDQLSPSVRDSLAVVTASKTPDSIAHAVVRARAETLFVHSEVSSAQSRSAEKAAQAALVSANAAAAAARAATTAQDSALHWHAAYDAEHRRGDSLQVALTIEHGAADSARSAGREFQRADSLSRFRLGRVEQLNADLVKETARLSAGCRLLPFVRCPTRKETAIGAATLATLVYDRVRRKP